MDGDAAVLARDGDHRLVLDIQLLLVADAVGPLDDHLGGCHGRGRIAARDRVVGELVLRRQGVEHRRQALGAEADVAARLPQRGAIRCRDERAGLRLVSDLAADRHEHRLVVVDQAHDVLARDVIGGDHDDALPVERVVELDAEQAGVGLRGADGGAEPRAGEDEVVRVLRLAGELGRPLAAQRSGGPGSSGRRRVGGDDEGRPCPAR